MGFIIGLLAGVLGSLVAGRVIQGFTQQVVSADSGDFDQHRVPSRNQQRDKWKCRRILFEQRREHVGFHVMNAHRRYVESERQRAPDEAPVFQSVWLW